MSEILEEFIKKEIMPNEKLIKERYHFYTIEVNEQLPEFFMEKVKEIKLMVLLGLDNYAVKSIFMLLEEIMAHVLISKVIKYEQQYLYLFRRVEKCRKLNSGWKILKVLKKHGLIQSDDYSFCAEIFNDDSQEKEEDKGKRLRNIEIHNLIAEKIDNTGLREEIKAKHNDLDNKILEKMIKGNPEFIHILARDISTRNLGEYFHKTLLFLNRSSTYLTKYKNLPSKESYKLNKGFSKGNVFYIDCNFTNDTTLEIIKKDIIHLGDVIKIEYIPVESTDIKGKFIITTRNNHTGLDFFHAIYKVKSRPDYDYRIVRTGLVNGVVDPE